MPRKAKTTSPETTPAAATPEATKKPPRGVKTAAIKRALKANKNKSPKEIADIVTAQGVPTTASQVSNVKFLLARETQKKAASRATDQSEAPADVPADAISLALLQKAKKLAAQLGGIKEAKAAIDALAQILD